VAIQAKSISRHTKEFRMCFVENAGATRFNMLLLKLKPRSWRYKMNIKKDAWLNFYSEEDIRKLLKHNEKVHARGLIFVLLLTFMYAILEGYRSLTPCGPP